MTFGSSIKSCFSKYATFSGRASRSEFWWFFLFCQLYSLVTAVIIIIPILGLIIWSLLLLPLLLPSLAVRVRRLHDIGKSGWWWFVCLIPIPGLFILFYWYLTDSEQSDNVYGPLPITKKSGIRSNINRYSAPYEQPRGSSFSSRPIGGYNTTPRQEYQTDETQFVGNRSQGAMLTLGSQQYPLSIGRNIIGRKGQTSRATIQIATDDMYMSRQHCCITVTYSDTGQLIAKISNADNKNQTLINGRILGHEMSLPATCNITMGRTTLKFTM